MGALTFPKSARLARRSEFAAVRENGRARHGKFMVLGGLLTGEKEAPRFGVVTTRKVGSAVERNRARRRLREIFRLHRSLLPAGLWMVVVLRRAAATTTYAALLEEWRVLAVRAGYLKT
jgi:ribonuclease P protein component